MSHVDVLMTYSEENEELKDGRFIEIKLIEFRVTWPGEDVETRLIARQDVGSRERGVVEAPDGAYVILLVPITADIHSEAAYLLVDHAAKKHNISARQLRLYAIDPNDKYRDMHCALVDSERSDLLLAIKQLRINTSHLANTTAESVKKLAVKLGIG